ncbi:MAG: hypothetical protein IPP78_05410 [Holophagaceae bacterium]|nr:hypothetical protein [Holophagaceae bacterium]
MRLRSLLPIILACLPLTAGASASATASVSIRIASKEWLAANDSRLLASQRTLTAISKGLVQENGSTFLLADFKGNTFKFEVPQGTQAPAGSVQINYVPLQDQGHQRLVAMSLNDRDLNRLR